jgi:hypothetical protein
MIHEQVEAGAGAGAGAVLRIYGSTKQEPKQIFTIPQHCF